MDAIVQRLCRENPDVSEEEIREFVHLRLQQQQEREYPSSFRSRVDACDDANIAELEESCSLRVRCHCGQCSFVASATKMSKAIRCHCASCRRFHTSAFAALLPVAGFPEDWGLAGQARRHRDQCSALGVVDRLMCNRCFSKLATLPQKGAALVSLGSVEDESVPVPLARRWQVVFEDLEIGSRATWWDALPGDCTGPRRVLRLEGRCACGSCAFAAELLPGEAQHCYCNLCRRLSGSVAQTWVPASNDSFQWTRNDGLRLVRTTGHGQRHMCEKCGGVLTIVYDSQPDCTWPVAGALDDVAFSGRNEGLWYRVIHICFSMMQPWYRLPNDGLPRLKFAG
eukprot:TRINITY_DN35063_c0_g1_i1.p1 TRINITY_DN35063_c0_g1~~TRINITY_DN35063_c0_g1_i1.p1  ORF type:complete len:340 (-),score=53.36 TRINITY_DN35063_c0_g1_i1:19-1038(-)